MAPVRPPSGRQLSPLAVDLGSQPAVAVPADLPQTAEFVPAIDALGEADPLCPTFRRLSTTTSCQQAATAFGPAENQQY